MLLPIGTDVRLRNYPSVTYVLIGLNMLIYAVSWSMSRVGGEHPTDSTILQISALFQSAELSSTNFHVWSLFTYQFMHASWWHVIGNMIFLLPFGKVVEDRLGHIGFLLLYLGCGALGGGLHVLLYNMPVVGASGSVCAITAAFAALAPRSRIRILFVFFIITIFEVPGLLLVIFQVAFDALNLLGTLGGIDGSPTAWVVHLGGYATGISIVYLLLLANIIPRGEHDLFKMISQANRRRVFRTVIADSSKPRKKVDHQLSSSDLTRSSIAQSLSSGKHQIATDQYLKVLVDEPDFVLDQRSRVDIANTLLRNNEIEKAVQLYELHLEHKPQPDDAPAVALLLAAKYARLLNNPKRSEELLDIFYDQFTKEHKVLADAIRTELNNP